MALPCIKMALPCMKMALPCIKMALPCIKMALPCIKMALPCIKMALYYIAMIQIALLFVSSNSIVLHRLDCVALQSIKSHCVTMLFIRIVDIGVRCEAYHAGMSTMRKKETHHKFLRDELQVKFLSSTICITEVAFKTLPNFFKYLSH